MAEHAAAAPSSRTSRSLHHHAAAPRSSSRVAASIATAALLLLLALLPAIEAGLCPPRCRCDDEKLSSSCAYASLDIIPIQLNPQITDLNLAGNRVDKLHATFEIYENLKSLDLSSNLISHLSHNFRSQKNLENLNLSSNAIRNLTKNSLQGLVKLRILDLSNNNITDLDETTFRYTSELEELNLSGNSITSLPQGLLRNLHRIRVLNFARNTLLDVPSMNLALAPSLEHLDFSDNLIQELDRDSIPSLPTLLWLTFANNVLRSIADEAFDRIPALKSLDLSGNNLTSVPSPALSKLKVLNNLLLSRNPLGELRNLAFSHLFELRNLEMDECSIVWVDGKAFTDNVNLERISMDGNRELTELPARVLHAAGNLRWVSLRRCSLGSLQPTQFPVDGLALLRVGGNPLVCNCSVHWLWNVLRTEERRGNSTAAPFAATTSAATTSGLEIDTQEIICADEEFAGKPLVSLPEGALKCRLSPLWLGLSVVACLLATGGVLALLLHVTRAKKRKRVPPYPAPTRPELLVYVGRANDGSIPDKHQESYSRRLIARTEELVYEAANQDYQRRKSGSESSESRETNVYETPRYTRPSGGTVQRSDPGFNAFYQEQMLQQQQQPVQPTTTQANHLYSTACDMLGDSQPEENLYAVADVTNLRDEPSAPPPEAMTLYRMQQQQQQQQQQHLRNTADRNRSRHHQHRPGGDYGYDYEYDYDPPPPPQKPHVVFV